MRVLQLIDTLETGGAERVAVNFANALAVCVDVSYLCATRKEGLLKDSIKSGVTYFFLKRKSTLDIKAIRKLNAFVKHQDINLIHAHASSFFLATIIKILQPRLKLVWHDHYGESEFLEKRPKRVLRFCSRYFNHIFSVNYKLKVWAETNLKTVSTSYLPNYAVLGSEPLVTKLKGEDNKRIVCLANLRPQKDHITLLKAFSELVIKFPDWTLHLVGKDFKDTYSKSLRAFIKSNELEDSVFIYGSCPDVSAILKHSTIGVLSSKSEGLPLALLEYGLYGLAVVATNVGDCSLVISNEKEGKLVSPQDDLSLKNALEFYINNPEKAKLACNNLNVKIAQDFSSTAILSNVLKIYQALYS